MSLILLVEDEPDVARIASRILASEHYDVVHAWNGKEALDLLAEMERLPAVILLDLAMPVMDGWETLAALRADARLADIPVVVVSAYSDSRLIGSKMEFTIGKPYSIDDLLTAVRACAAA